MANVALDYPLGSPHRISPTSIGVVLAAHCAVLVGLMSFERAPGAFENQPLMVRMLPTENRIAPPQPAPPKKTAPPKSPTKPTASTPTLATQNPSLAANEVATTPVAEPSPPQRTSAPEAATSQPRFDADYLDNPMPTYPLLSRRLREEGKVLLRVLVESDGRPTRIEIKTSSGSARLDQAAEQAVWRWKFIPAKRGNEAVSAWVVVPISFNLKV